MEKIKSSKDKGMFGEDAAVAFLEKNGYRILERNFRCKSGEIDIVAWEKNQDSILVFVEVKYRSNGNYGLPCEAVSKRQQARLRRTAETYLAYRKLTGYMCRMDIIEIYGMQEGIFLRQLRDCF